MLLYIPYRPEVKLDRKPVLTIFVIVACLLIYWAQERNYERIIDYTKDYCAYKATPEFIEAVSQRAGGDRTRQCVGLLTHVYVDASKRRQAEHYSWHENDIRKTLGDASLEAFREGYRAYMTGAPVYLDAGLVDLRDFNPLRMLSASLSHGSWEHVIGNSIFFYAFASAVELVLGPVLFLLVFFVLSMGVGLIDSLAHIMVTEPIPSLGLSGVVTGYIALFAYFMPRVRIRVFFWFIVFFGTIGVPAWVLAVWYIGLDAFTQITSSGTYVNYIAHLGGAITALAMGLAMFRKYRHWADQLEPETLDLTQDESWWRKFAALYGFPVVAGFAFLAAVMALTVVVWFVDRFALQLLLMSPAILAMAQMWRVHRAGRPDWARYKEAIHCLERYGPETAAPLLEQLAHRGYTRAQYVMAELLSQGKGVVRDTVRAAEYYLAAAERGHTAAQYRLGIVYVDGTGVERNWEQARHWLMQAANSGHGQAAMTLGHYHEYGPRDWRDPMQAADWYATAAHAFFKAGHYADADAALRSLQALEPHAPRTQELVHRLTGLTARSPV